MKRVFGVRDDRASSCLCLTLLWYLWAWVSLQCSRWIGLNGFGVITLYVTVPGWAEFRGGADCGMVLGESEQTVGVLDVVDWFCRQSASAAYRCIGEWFCYMFPSFSPCLLSFILLRNKSPPPSFDHISFRAMITHLPRSRTRIAATSAPGSRCRQSPLPLRLAVVTRCASHKHRYSPVSFLSGKPIAQHRQPTVSRISVATSLPVMATSLVTCKATSAPYRRSTANVCTPLPEMYSASTCLGGG